jgi:Fe-S oxidoreductase
MQITGTKYSYGCPSISRYNFHAYSGGGRLVTAYAMAENRIEFTDNLLDIIYKCNLCGSCDIACKYSMDIEVLQPMYELRAKAVEEGQLNPVHMLVIEGLRKEDNMLQSTKSERADWAQGLDVKIITQEKVDTYFHVGCRYSFDKELWPMNQRAVNLFKKANIDFGIAGNDETCCGGRAYELGYQGELTKYAESNIDLWKSSGIKTVVTNCADCYHHFKVLYDKIGLKGDIEILHLTEYFDRLIREGKILPKNSINETVTYHDPCHLGRLGEPWVHWDGEVEIEFDKRIHHVPQKKFRKGTNGVYEAPRNILKSIPGLRLEEMHRIKEYAWCCGAGGGVIEAFPEFNQWTANERLNEALDTGASSIVTSCGWCMRSFLDAAEETGTQIKVYDVIELLEKSI